MKSIQNSLYRICELPISCRRPVEDEEERRNIEKYLIQRWYAKSAMILGTIDQHYVEATHTYQYYLWICSFWLQKCFLFEYEELFGQWNGLYLMCFVPSRVGWYTGCKKSETRTLSTYKKGYFCNPQCNHCNRRYPFWNPFLGRGTQPHRVKVLAKTRVGTLFSTLVSKWGLHVVTPNQSNSQCNPLTTPR